jgi:hypothetical protein
MGDIFNVIADRDSKPAAAKFKSVKRYGISVNDKWSRRFYEFRKAQRIVSRAKRMGFDCWMSPVMATIKVQSA